MAVIPETGVIMDHDDNTMRKIRKDNRQIQGAVRSFNVKAKTQLQRIPAYLRNTWIIPVAIAAFLLSVVALDAPDGLPSITGNRIAGSLGGGLGSWFLGLLIVGISRHMGKFQDDTASTRFVWAASITFLILSFYGGLGN